MVRFVQMEGLLWGALVLLCGVINVQTTSEDRPSTEVQEKFVSGSGDSQEGITDALIQIAQVSTPL